MIVDQEDEYRQLIEAFGGGWDRSAVPERPESRVPELQHSVGGAPDELYSPWMVYGKNSIFDSIPEFGSAVLLYGRGLRCARCWD